jgi:hypothetical protein
MDNLIGNYIDNFVPYYYSYSYAGFSYNVKKTKTTYPVSLNELKTHLRIDQANNEDDDYLTNNVIKAATRKAENFIDKDIALTKCVYTVNDYSSSYLNIPEGNLISFDYLISDASTLLNYSDLEIEEGEFHLEFDNIVTSDPLTLQFTTGYATNMCPEDIKQAIMIECGNYYDMERSSYSYSNVKKSDVFERLLQPHKIIRW